MSQPFQPLLDAGVEPTDITARVALDSQGVFWRVDANASLDGVQVAVVGLSVHLPSAVAQCLSQLNQAKGNNIEVVAAHG